MKHLTVTLVLLLGQLSVQVQAAPYFQLPGLAATPATTPRPARPDLILSHGIRQLGNFLAGDASRDPRRVQAFLEREIAGYFDFRTMSRWAAGPAFRRLTPAQKERFAAKLRGHFLGAVARNLGSFAHPLPRITVYPVRSTRPDDERTVRARVMPRSGFPINMDFRFYRTRNGWKVFDIAANGASAVTYYRRHFAARVSSRGPAALYD